MAITLQQIADLAGVSRGTVDRALNNRGRIKPEVEQRIKKIAKDVDLIATSKDKKKIAYIKKDMLYVYSWEENLYLKKIKLQMKTPYYEMQFIDDKYIAVRDNSYMHWYEL